MLSFFLQLLAFIIIQSKPSDPCLKYTFKNEESNKCVKKEANAFEVTKCPEGTYCDFKFDTDAIECKKDPKYPGLPCTSSDECISKSCIGNICQGVKHKEACQKVSECLFDYTCREVPYPTPTLAAVFQCLLPISNIEDPELPLESTNPHPIPSCKQDTDCIRGFGCLHLDNKANCTRYYSVPDKVKIGKDNKRFCMNYFENDGYCETITNIDSITEPSKEIGKCTKPCKYRNRFYETFLLDNRDCATDGNGYCPKGNNNNDEEYHKYLSLAKLEFINNTNCHLDERFTACQKDLTSEDTSPDKIVVNNYLRYSWVNYRHRIDDNTKKNHLEYIRSNLFNESIPEKTFDQCPKFQCSAKVLNKSCLVSTYEKPSLSSSIVELTPNCEKNQLCSIDGTNPYLLMQGKDVYGYCKDIPSSLMPLSYPGEPCNSDADCYNKYSSDKVYGKCTNNKCYGKAKNEECKETFECVQGFYCHRDPTGNLCKEQKDIGEPCRVSHECLNNLLCFNRTCEDALYSLKENEAIIIDQEEEFPSDLYCQFGKSKDNRCIVYNNTKYRNNKEDFASTNVTINECKYDVTGKGTIQIKKSECGYNAEGKAYCPLAHDSRQDIWRKYFKARIRRYTNNCHTLNRYNCLSSDPNALADIKFYSHYLENGHLYHNAVRCAIEVLGSKYMRRSLIMMGLITLIMI